MHTDITAISAGIIKNKDVIKIDKTIIRNTIQLMEVWNDIFNTLNISSNEVKDYDINNILKMDENLLYNLDFNNLIETLKKYLSKLNISLILY